MKTAEERMMADGIIITPVLRYHIDQMRLDAMKEGMRRAEQIVNKLHITQLHYSDIMPPHYNLKEMEQAILTASEQLTTKDL